MGDQSTQPDLSVYAPQNPMTMDDILKGLLGVINNSPTGSGAPSYTPGNPNVPSMEQLGIPQQQINAPDGQGPQQPKAAQQNGSINLQQLLSNASNPNMQEGFNQKTQMNLTPADKIAADSAKKVFSSQMDDFHMTMSLGQLGDLINKQAPAQQSQASGNPNGVTPTPQPQGNNQPQVQSHPLGDLLNSLKGNPDTNTDSLRYVAASSPFSLGGVTKDGKYEDQGAIIKLLQLAAIGKVPTGPAEASMVQQMRELTPAQRAERKAGIYGAQIGAYKDLSTSLDTDEERANTTLNTMLTNRPMYEKMLGVGQTKKIISDFRDRIKNIHGHKEMIQQGLGATAVNPPNIEGISNNSTRTGASVSAANEVRSLDEAKKLSTGSTYIYQGVTYKRGK